MSKVFVIDATKKPLSPCHPARARKLLSEGKAAVFKMFPFTIILKREVEAVDIQPFRIKIDPGSKVTGIVIVNDETGEVVFAAEIEHRGDFIKKKMTKRSASRRSRRSRKTRYRQARFKNRKRSSEWMPPSLESRVSNITTWVGRLIRICPIQAISQELVKFDLQKMENPEISGIEYQQGELRGYEIREYLLEKSNRQCVYCKKKNVPLQVEHIVPRSRGGSKRISNLTIACGPCNQKKNNRTAEEFGFPEVQKQAKQPLKDATAVNATRWALYERLKGFGFPIEVGSGGLTKFNRTRLGIEKGHWQDAACVGKSASESLDVAGIKPLLISAKGHGDRQMCRMDKHGFPRTSPKGGKFVQGFQTGDMVKVIVPKGKKQGTYFGRVAVRTSGSFDITTASKKIEGINFKFCHAVHRCDGYSYSEQQTRSSASSRP